MKTKKLFLTYNGPDDSIILWDKKEKEVLCSWGTDISISEILKDIEKERRVEGEIFKICLTLSFDILKNLNSEEKTKMKTIKVKEQKKQIKKTHEENKKNLGKEIEQQKITLEEKKHIANLYKNFSINKEVNNQIRQKALYQIVWAEGKSHYSELSAKDEIEFKKPGTYNNKPLTFLENKKSFTFKELDRILSSEEFRKPDDWGKIGGYIKHKIALFCSSGDSLLDAMIY